MTTAEVYAEPTGTIVTTAQVYIKPTQTIVTTAEDRITGAATAEESRRIKQEVLEQDEILPASLPPSPSSPQGTPLSSPEDNVSLSPTDRASLDETNYELSPHIFATVNAGIESLVKKANNSDMALKIKQEKLSSDEENLSDEEN